MRMFVSLPKSGQSSYDGNRYTNESSSLHSDLMQRDFIKGKFKRKIFAIA